MLFCSVSWDENVLRVWGGKIWGKHWLQGGWRARLTTTDASLSHVLWKFATFYISIVYRMMVYNHSSIKLTSHGMRHMVHPQYHLGELPWSGRAHLVRGLSEKTNEYVWQLMTSRLSVFYITYFSLCYLGVLGTVVLLYCFCYSM